MKTLKGSFLVEPWTDEFKVTAYCSRTHRSGPCAVFLPGSIPILVEIVYSWAKWLADDMGYVVAMVTPPKAKEQWETMALWGAGFAGASLWLKHNTTANIGRLGWFGQSLGGNAPPFGLPHMQQMGVPDPKAVVSISPGCPDPTDGEHDPLDQIIWDSYKGWKIPTRFIWGTEDCVVADGAKTHYLHCEGKADLQQITGANHFGWTSQPARLISELLDILGILPMDDCRALITGKKQLAVTQDLIESWFREYL